MPMSSAGRKARAELAEILRAGAYDMHLHTIASDGTATPEQLVREVLSGGLKAFSVTDHDTVASIDGTQNALKERTLSSSVRFVPGVELGADLEVVSGHTVEIHLLGYFPLGGIGAMEAELRRQRKHRHDRNIRMCELLTSLGMPVSLEELEAETALSNDTHSGRAGKGESVVGRVQAANILVRKGYAETRRDAFNRFLNPDRPGYAERYRPTLEEAIRTLNGCGGVPVLAHPHVYGWTGEAPGLHGATLEDMLIRLSGMGLAGVEAFHGEANGQAIREIVSAGRSASLVLTGGSDWHGDNRHAAMYTRETDFSKYFAED